MALEKKFDKNLLKLCNEFPITEKNDIEKGYTKKFISKEGEEYNRVLFEIFSGKNKNDKPFTVKDILQQPKLSEFIFQGVKDFKLICDLIATKMVIKTNDTLTKIDKKSEKIIPSNFVDKECENIFNESLGICYIITALVNNSEYIIKIGQSRTTFKDRLQSYNCGNVSN